MCCQITGLVQHLIHIPSLPDLAQRVVTGCSVSGNDPDEKAYSLPIPPVTGFSPPVEDICNPVEPLAPDESGRLKVFVFMDGNGLIDEYGHLAHIHHIGKHDYNRTYVLMSRD